MELDINEFRERFAKVKAGARNEAEIADYIHKEIRLTENMKSGLMEEMNENNKDFLNGAANKFDTYMFQLQEIEKEMNFASLSLDQEVALKDTAMRRKIEKDMDKLHKMDPEKYEEEGDKGREER